MTTIDTSLLDSLNLSQKTATKSDNKGIGQDEFLKLMTTQMNNQDPLKPMQSGEFFSQIAQFSSVAGIQDLQKTFSQVASAMQSSQALQASAMVGRAVLIPSSQAELKEGANVQGTVELPSSTTGLALGVFDAAGQLVRQINMGAQASGSIPFNWDGLTDDGKAAPAGMYQLKAIAEVDGNPVAADTNIAAKVDSVIMGKLGQEVTLNLGALGRTGISNVKQIL
jgi:flagellar basal-body rod modification protein FlgD